VALTRLLRVATRGSELARWQARLVGQLLAAAVPGVTAELVVVETTGDRRTDLPIWAIGGQGVFVREVQAAVLEGRADIAVHSAKDLPAIPSDGLSLAAFPVRADPRDALVGSRLDDLAPGAPIATGSVRRRAQLAWLRPDTAACCDAIDDRDVRLAVESERAFLARLGGGCELPVGALAHPTPAGLRVEGLMASLDGHILLRDAEEGPAADGALIGARLAERLLTEAGGAGLLDAEGWA
jgi:porphobilinogen deaminase